MIPTQQWLLRPHVHSQENIQGMERVRLKTYCFFMDMEKAHGIVWRDGLWKHLTDFGINPKMWRLLKNMTEYTTSAAMLK